MSRVLSPKARFLLRAWLVLLGLLLVPLFIINLYSYPTLDDFWYSSRVVRFGFWGGQRQLLADTSARLLSNFLMSLFPLSKGVVWWAKLNLFWLFPLFWLSLYSFCISLGKVMRLEAPLWCSFAFAALFFIALPGVYEGIYWTSAVVVYQLSLVLFIWWVKYLVAFRTEPRGWHIPVTALLSAAMLLLNEPILLYQCGAVFLLFLYSSACKAERRILAVNALFIAGTLAFIFLSKANWDKTDRLARAHSFNLSFTLVTALRGISAITLRSMLNPLTIGTMLLACYYQLFGVRLRPRRLVVVTLVLLGAYYASTLPVIYVYGRACPLRILNMGTLFLIPLVGAWLTCFYERYLRAASRLLFITAAAGIIAYLALAQNNPVQACRNLQNHSIQNFARQMNARFQCLNDPKVDSCAFYPIINPPAQLSWSDWDIIGFTLVDVQHTYRKRVHIVRK
jgi:hypothetical protein